MKSSHFTFHAGLIFFFASLAGCGGSPSSNPQWGRSQRGSLGRQTILDLKPDQTLVLCTKGSDKVKRLAEKAIATYLAVVGRSSLRIDSSAQTCATLERDPMSFPYAVFAEVPSNEPSCRGGRGGFNEGRDSLRSSYRRIVICPDMRDNDRAITQTFLHEFGHSFGFCDQYNGSRPSEDPEFHAHCDAQIRSDKPRVSIMNVAIIGEERTSLTDDDVTGLRIMACRSESPANSLWMEKVRSSVASWRTNQFKGDLARLKLQNFKFLPECEASR